ncbi:hypothetical protein AN416_34000 (plasmid) [Paraburkholderia caribensis]|nr:hypothetical protein AN416_34000 [Paraburkholderia caribensis]AUT57372.1 hypothetical protein C2L66_37105 [Paraburkholderia caribensis]
MSKIVPAKVADFGHATNVIECLDFPLRAAERVRKVAGLTRFSGRPFAPGRSTRDSSAVFQPDISLVVIPLSGRSSHDANGF